LDRLLEYALFVVGLIFGSFLNVCISRIPRDESIISPPSHCQSCGARLRWYDNIPLLSWILLRGRCRDCKQRISARYPAVELLTAIAFVACAASFGLSWITLKFCIFAFLLIGLIFMDAETGLLPREFTYSGIVIGLVLSWTAHTDSAATLFLLRTFGKTITDPDVLSLVDAFVGAAVGAGFFYLAWALYYLVRKAHGLGFGDISLMAMSGAFLGLKLIVLVTVLAPLFSVIYVGALLTRDSFRPHPAKVDEAYDTRPFLKREIPFGVFLGACSLFAIFAGESVWKWYLGMF
jgi:leader peptidase (prepilin peptidase) / N-methyltransferase